MSSKNDNKPNVVCGIILYNPETNIVEKIKGYSKTFQKVYVFDNTETTQNQVADAITSIQSTVYITEGKNIGLPRAYNRILDQVDIDADYLCCLDQDSVFPEKEIRKMITILRKIPRNCAVIGPHIIYHSEEYAKKDAFLGRRYVITSGSFVNMKLLRENKIRFDEKYFIDKFEVDLDMQFRVKGYKIAEYCGACLYQQLGDTGKNGKTNHSPLRHYYLFRNRLYFNNKWFGSNLKKYGLNVLQTSRHIFRIVKNEDNKIDKLKQLPIAVNDYLNHRMGKKQQ